jgi:hypothetical protein
MVMPAMPKWTVQVDKSVFFSTALMVTAFIPLSGCRTTLARPAFRGLGLFPVDATGMISGASHARPIAAIYPMAPACPTAA